jgi:hypothetical protein
MGDRVFHQKFGYGVISEINGNKLSIEFDKVGQRRWSIVSSKGCELSPRLFADLKTTVGKQRPLIVLPP